MELKKSLQLLKKDFSFKHFIPMTNRTPRKINKINLDRTRHNSTGIKPYENIEKIKKKPIFPYSLSHKNANIFIYPKIISRTNIINENQKNSLITNLSFPQQFFFELTSLFFSKGVSKTIGLSLIWLSFTTLFPPS